MTHRRCTRCGEDKPLADFAKDRYAPGGVKARCRACDAALYAERGGKQARVGNRPFPTRANGEPPVPMDQEDTTPGAFATGERFSGESWASIPDVHDPNHDVWAWAIALEVIHRHRPKLLHIAGDLMDCASLSVHEPTSLRKPDSFEDEVVSANRRLDEIASVIPQGCKVVFTEGNHEFRWVREFAKFAHHSALRGTTMPELLGMERRGWLWVPFRESYRVPGTNLRLTHSLEKFGVNSVRDHAKDIGDGSIVFGDIHRRELIELGDADGNYRFSACFGWLGDVSRISYMHRTKCLRTWRHGLGVGWFDGGRAYPHTVPIVGKKAFFDGRLIKAS